MKRRKSASSKPALINYYKPHPSNRPVPPHIPRIPNK